MKSSREQFEGWAASNNMDISKFKYDGFTNPYIRTKTRIAYNSWQASREYMIQEEVTTAPFIKVSE